MDASYTTRNAQKVRGTMQIGPHVLHLEFSVIALVLLNARISHKAMKAYVNAV